MFGLGSAGMGSAPYPNNHRPSSKRKMSRKDNTPPTSKHLTYPSVEFFEPAIDGPPSPQGIRAYTEQMRRAQRLLPNRIPLLSHQRPLSAPVNPVSIPPTESNYSDNRPVDRTAVAWRQKIGPIV
ncbi:hypothetical protein H4I96_06796 [Botrytis cinerea]